MPKLSELAAQDKYGDSDPWTAAAERLRGKYRNRQQASGPTAGVEALSQSFLTTPRRAMEENPYPAGSEEADYYNAVKAQKAQQFVPEAIMSMAGLGPVRGSLGALGGKMQV